MAQVLREIIEDCEIVSVQMVNRQNLSLAFSPNTNHLLCDSIQNILKTLQVSCHSHYLELSAFMARDKKSSFASAREKIVNRMVAWMEKSFSTTAKETLFKLVIQVVPYLAHEPFLASFWYLLRY